MINVRGDFAKTIELFINGELVPTLGVHIHFDNMRKAYLVEVNAPDLAAATRLLPEVAKAKTVDHVMNTWQRGV